MHLCCLNVLGGAFGVKTEFVSVDFNDGATAYDKIRPHLENKNIGVLGQSPYLHSFFILPGSCAIS